MELRELRRRGGERPERNLLLALSLGTAALIAIYLSANVAYMRVLSVPTIATTTAWRRGGGEVTMGFHRRYARLPDHLLSIIGASNGAILTFAPPISPRRARVVF